MIRWLKELFRHFDRPRSAGAGNVELGEWQSSLGHMGMHPVTELIERMSDLDFAVLGHSFAPHGRDYLFIVQDTLARNRGTHELTFTHVVQIEYQTRVADDVWPYSWTDELTKYESWKSAGEPDGYVWGTNWSLAYPGLAAIQNSLIASQWTDRLKRHMYEATLETDRFFMRLIFHSLRTRKLNDDVGTISRVLIPLGPGAAK